MGLPIFFHHITSISIAEVFHHVNIPNVQHGIFLKIHRVAAVLFHLEGWTDLGP
jgi:hypothetical protein